MDESVRSCWEEVENPWFRTISDAQKHFNVSLPPSRPDQAEDQFDEGCKVLVERTRRFYLGQFMCFVVGEKPQGTALDNLLCGVLLPGPYGNSDGKWRGKRHFVCEPAWGLFVPFNTVRLLRCHKNIPWDSSPPHQKGRRFVQGEELLEGKSPSPHRDLTSTPASTTYPNKPPVSAIDRHQKKRHEDLEQRNLSTDFKELEGKDDDSRLPSTTSSSDALKSQVALTDIETTITSEITQPTRQDDPLLSTKPQEPPTRQNDVTTIIQDPHISLVSDTGRPPPVQVLKQDLVALKSFFTVSRFPLVLPDERKKNTLKWNEKTGIALFTLDAINRSLIDEFAASRGDPSVTWFLWEYYSVLALYSPDPVNYTEFPSSFRALKKEMYVLVKDPPAIDPLHYQAWVYHLEFLCLCIPPEEIAACLQPLYDSAAGYEKKYGYALSLALFPVLDIPATRYHHEVQAWQHTMREHVIRSIKSCCASNPSVFGELSLGALTGPTHSGPGGSSGEGTLHSMNEAALLSSIDAHIAILRRILERAKPGDALLWAAFPLGVLLQLCMQRLLLLLTKNNESSINGESSSSTTTTTTTMIKIGRTNGNGVAPTSNNGNGTGVGSGTSETDAVLEEYLKLLCLLIDDTILGSQFVLLMAAEEEFLLTLLQKAPRSQQLEMLAMSLIIACNGTDCFKLPELVATLAVFE